MKYTTLKEINELRNIIAGRRRRVEGLKKLIENGISTKDLEWIEKEIAEHEDFLKKAEAEIKKFYTPAA